MFENRGIDFVIADRPINETASRVAAGLVNPLTGRAFRPGWRQEECLSAADSFYTETECLLDGNWWQKTPIYREIADEDQLEIWEERQVDEIASRYAGPLFPWPDGWQGKGRAAYTRGSAVLHVEGLVNSLRDHWLKTGRFVEAEIGFKDILEKEDGFFWNGSFFSHVVWCTGWEAGTHPEMQPLKGRPSKGTIIDLVFPELEWNAGVLHFGHWLVHHQGMWRFGATYAWSWENPYEAEMPAVQELMNDLARRYDGRVDMIKARAAIRPIVRRSQPVAGPIPGLKNQYVFSGLGSKGVTTAPWSAGVLADHLQNGRDIPVDLDPAALWPRT